MMRIFDKDSFVVSSSEGLAMVNLFVAGGGIFAGMIPEAITHGKDADGTRIIGIVAEAVYPVPEDSRGRYIGIWFEGDPDILFRRVV